MTTKALDVACGPKSFYFDKEDPRVTFCDLHTRHKVGERRGRDGMS